MHKPQGNCPHSLRLRSVHPGARQPDLGRSPHAATQPTWGPPLRHTAQPDNERAAIETVLTKSVENAFQIIFVNYCNAYLNKTVTGFPGGSVVKNPPPNAGDTSLIPGSGRSPGEGNGNPLQCSCLENAMDGGA